MSTPTSAVTSNAANSLQTQETSSTPEYKEPSSNEPGEVTINGSDPIVDEPPVAC